MWKSNHQDPTPVCLQAVLLASPIHDACAVSFRYRSYRVVFATHTSRFGYLLNGACPEFHLYRQGKPILLLAHVASAHEQLSLEHPVVQNNLWRLARLVLYFCDVLQLKGYGR